MSDIAIKRRFGSTADIATRVLPSTEIEIDTSKNTIVVHNGTDAGGVPLAKEVHTHANATTSVAGFMSAPDKVKLDGISAVGGYDTVENDGVAVTQRDILNFSSDFSVVDDNSPARTDISISAAFRDEIATQSLFLALILEG